MKKFTIALGCLFLASVLSALAQTNTPPTKSATWSIVPALPATCLAEYEKKIEALKKEFKFVPIEEWKGVKFIFVPRPKRTQEFGYNEFTGGKDKDGHLTYEEAVGRIGTITEVVVTKSPEVKYDITLKMDDNGQIYKSTLYEPTENQSPDKLTSCGDIAPIADVEKAKRLWLGKTFWPRYNLMKYPLGEKDESVKAKFKPVKVIDVLPGLNVCLIFETESGEKGFQYCIASGFPIYLSADQLKNKWDLIDYFFLEDPKKLYPWDEKTWKAIEERKLLIGMTCEQAKLCCMYKPNKINRTTTAKGTDEVWIFKDKYTLTFENGILTKIEE